MAVFVCESGFGLLSDVYTMKGYASQRHIGRAGKNFGQLVLCFDFKVIRAHTKTCLSLLVFGFA